MRNCYVYILANKKNGAVHRDFTDDIERRVGVQKNGCFRIYIKIWCTTKLIAPPLMRLKGNNNSKNGKRIEKLNYVKRIILIGTTSPRIGYKMDTRLRGYV